MHDHENELVCLAGELTVITEDDAVTHGELDSVWLKKESHRLETTGQTRAVGAEIIHAGALF